MEQSRPGLDEWFRKADEVLMEEGIVLDALKKAVEGGWVEPEEAEQEIIIHHYLICPDIAGRDL